MADTCPKCDSPLYGGWHTIVPGRRIDRCADDTICLMVEPLRKQLAQAKADSAKWEQMYLEEWKAGEDARAENARLKELREVCDEMCPDFRACDVSDFHGYFSSWDEYADGFKSAWPGEILGWGDSPAELLTRLINERDELQEENAKLLKANAAFLKAWGKAGPDGSGQWEKFDVAVRLAKQAETQVAQQENMPCKWCVEYRERWEGKASFEVSEVFARNDGSAFHFVERPGSPVRQVRCSNPPKQAEQETPCSTDE